MQFYFYIIFFFFENLDLSHAQLGVQHSEIQIELEYVASALAGTCKIVGCHDFGGCLRFQNIVNVFS